MNRIRLTSAAMWLSFTCASALAADAPLRTGNDAFGDFSTDAPGTRRMITVQDLPQPFVTPSVDHGAKITTRPTDPGLHVPAGFEVDLLADHFSEPRKIITAPNGDLFVIESNVGPGQSAAPG